MSMEPISIDEAQKIAKEYGLLPIRIKGTTQVQICKEFNPEKYEIVEWDEFEVILNDKNLCVGKAFNSDFLKSLRKNEMTRLIQPFHFFLFNELQRLRYSSDNLSE